MDAFDEVTRCRLIEGLGDRDQGDSVPAQKGPDGDVVFHVASQTIDLVEDHGADVSFLADAGQHGAHLRAIDRLGRLLAHVPATSLGASESQFQMVKIYCGSSPSLTLARIAPDKSL